MHKPVVVPGIPSVKWDQVRETCVLREKLCSVVGWRAVWSACLYCPQNQTQLQNQMLSLLGESVKKMLRKHIKDHDKDYHTVHLRRVRLTLLDSHGCYKLGRLVTNCRLLLGPKASSPCDGRASSRSPNPSTNPSSSALEKAMIKITLGRGNQTSISKTK